jgi:hypothetical protein
MAEFKLRSSAPQNYFLPPPSTLQLNGVTTWRDHVSLNETIWRDFTSLKKIVTISARWEALRPAEFAVARAFHDSFIVDRHLSFFLKDYPAEGFEWTLSLDPDSMKLSHVAFTGLMTGATQFEVLYQVGLIFRAERGANYVLP